MKYYNISILIPKEAKEVLEQYCKEHKTKKATFITKLIKQDLKERGMNLLKYVGDV